MSSGFVSTIIFASLDWFRTDEYLVALLVQLPYGIIADKYGRRPVLFLSLFGLLLEGCFTILICKLCSHHLLSASILTPSDPSATS